MIIEQKIVMSRRNLGDSARVSITHSPTGYYRRVTHDDGHVEFFPFDMSRVKPKDNMHPTPTKHFNTGAKIGANKRKKKEPFDD